MKSSLYNVSKKGENGYILVNTFTGAVAHIDEETKRLLEETPDRIPEDIQEMFIESGFVVEDHCDERKILAYYFDKDKYNVASYNLIYTVAMTYACNLGCPYCYEGREKDTKTLDSKGVDIILKCIEKTLSKKSFKVLMLSLYGGEPLLAYHQCVQLMKGASTICSHQGKEFRGEMITNGVLINKETITTLLEPYCDWIQVTMDGGREAHNIRKPLKNGNGTYDHLLDVLELLRDADISFTLKLNIDKENVDTFADLYRDLKERGLESVRKSLGRIYPSHVERVKGSCATYSEKCFSLDEGAEYMDRVRAQMGEMETPHYPSKIVRHSPCIFDREDNYVVDPYVDIYNCLEFLGQKEKKVGHIDETGEMIFTCEYYDQMSRDPLTIEECRDCIYLPLCGGGCATHAYFENGTYHSSVCRNHVNGSQKYREYVEFVMEEMMSQHIDATP